MLRPNTVEEPTKTEVVTSEDVLDLSGKGLKKMANFPKRSSVSKLILDHNNITKIENLDAFPKLCSLSIMSNHLVRMNGINFGKNLTTVSLSNNGIVSMEGLCWLVHLEHLDLSKNNVKRIQNVSYCVKLQYMDLSENSITDISDLSSLINLKVLLLHGNAITTLQRVEVNLPTQLETLSLASNGISDLNEMCHLSSLSSLEHLSVEDNPCVMMTASMPEFDCRPFLVFCCPSLLSLDDYVVTDNERNNAERLRCDENLLLFGTGNHLQLIYYLSEMCPLATAPQLQDEQRKLLEEFLETQRLGRLTRTSERKTSGNGFASRNGEQSRTGVYGGKPNKTSELSDLVEYDLRAGYIPMHSTNGSENLFNEEDDVNDLLCSESSFLPVYSPLKKSLETSHRNYRDDFDQSLMWKAQEESVPNDQEFPIMTEEEANKLIHLAATILQAHIRGFLVRRKFHFKDFKREYDAACKIQALWKGYHFRHHSLEGMNFKHELRIRRIQKYVATVCLMMQKAEQQHEFEKQQLLEVVTILYQKLTELSDKVEQQKIETENQRNKLEQNAAVTLQKHWRGYTVRKDYPKLMSSNKLELLLNSHNELTKKVMYLESLLIKDYESDFAIETQDHFDPVFLPHPRFTDSKHQHGMTENFNDSDARNILQTEQLSSVDVFHCGEIDKDGDNNETSSDEHSKEQEIVDDDEPEDKECNEKCFDEETKEQECKENNHHAVVDQEISVPANKHDDMDNEIGNEDPLKVTTDGTSLDSTEPIYVGDEVEKNTSENAEDHDKNVGEDLQQKCNEDHSGKDIIDILSQNDITKHVPQATSDEQEDKKEENKANGNQTRTNEDDLGEIDDSKEVRLENEEITTEVIRDDSEHREIEGGFEGNTLDQEGHTIINTMFDKLPDDQDEKTVELSDSNVKPTEEFFVETGNEKTDEIKEEKLVESADKVQHIASCLSESNSEDQQNSSPEAEYSEAPIAARKTSVEITVDLEDPPKSPSETYRDKRDNKDDESFIETKKQENMADEAHESEADVKISPRLGKRASSLLSALQTELSTPTSKSSNVEEIPSQATPHAPLGHPENVISTENNDLSAHSAACNDIRTSTVGDGNDEKSNTLDLES